MKTILNQLKTNSFFVIEKIGNRFRLTAGKDNPNFFLPKQELIQLGIEIINLAHNNNHENL